MSRICEAKSVAVMLLWLLTSPLLVGQIKLPGGITIPVPNQGNQLPNRGRFPGNNRPDLAKVCPPIVTWMQTMATEYPSVDFQHTAVDRLEVMMITLFADPLFEPVFGRPYSKLTEADMQSIGREKLHPCAASPYRSQMIVVVPTDYAFISRLTMHPLSPSRLVSELEALAQARRSLAAEEAAIPALPGTPETYDKLKVLSRNHAEDLKLVFPSERTAFTKVLGEAVARSAQPTLEAKMSTLMANRNVQRQKEELQL